MLNKRLTLFVKCWPFIFDAFLIVVLFYWLTSGTFFCILISCYGAMVKWLRRRRLRPKSRVRLPLALLGISWRCIRFQKPWCSAFSYEKRCTVFHSISHKMGNFLGNILNTQVGSVTAFKPFFIYKSGKHLAHHQNVVHNQHIY